MESVSQIEKQLWHKLRNKLSLSPVSIRILEVLKIRSKNSKPTFINTEVAYISNVYYNNDDSLLISDEGHHDYHCYSKRNQKV